VKCRVCIGNLVAIRTDLPFKLSDRKIVIIKDLPVFQCERCSEYSIDDPIFARVEEMLSGSDKDAELEIVSFAA
jgi:YgiT-type zinc finger domain-containing protein